MFDARQFASARNAGTHQYALQASARMVLISVYQYAPWASVRMLRISTHGTYQNSWYASVRISTHCTHQYHWYASVRMLNIVYAWYAPNRMLRISKLRISTHYRNQYSWYSSVLMVYISTHGTHQYTWYAHASIRMMISASVKPWALARCQSQALWQPTFTAHLRFDGSHNRAASTPMLNYANVHHPASLLYNMQTVISKKILVNFDHLCSQSIGLQ